MNFARIAKGHSLSTISKAYGIGRHFSAMSVQTLQSLESKLPRVGRYFLRFSSVDAVCEYQRANRIATTFTGRFLGYSVWHGTKSVSVASSDIYS